MILFILDDGSEVHSSFYSGVCMAVWAHSGDEAVTFFRHHYPDQTEDESGNLLPYSGRVNVYPADCKGVNSLRDTVHEETRPTVLRLCRWRYEDERQCERCDLWANGLEEFRVCMECGGCRKCGCGPDCPLKEVS